MSELSSSEGHCRVLFPSEVRLPPVVFEGAQIEDRTYKCPVCTQSETYAKSDLFYDNDQEEI